MSFPTRKSQPVPQAGIVKKSDVGLYKMQQPFRSGITSMSSSKKLQNGNNSTWYISNYEHQLSSNCSSTTQSSKIL